jgi:hypothetical protein
MLGDEMQQALGTITHLRGVLDAIVIRGVRGVAGEQLRELGALAAEMDRIGATHAGAVLGSLVGQIQRDAAIEAATTLMTLISHARLLDRLLTLQATSAAYAYATMPEGGDE